MRMDYILYAIAILFFIITLSSVVYTSLQQREVWIVSTAVLGLAFVGFGYTQKPKMTTTPSTAKPSELPLPQQQQQQQMIAVNTTPPQPIVEVTTPPTTQPEAAETAKPPEAKAIVEQPQTIESILTNVKGIGEKRATQLKAIGISSIEDLAQASPKDLASKLNISPKITGKWVENAKEVGQKP